jgi:hypothetical protein
MKNIILGTFFSLFLIACSSSNTESYTIAACTSFFKLLVNSTIKCEPVAYSGAVKLEPQPQFKFSSSDTSVLTVSESGVISGKGAGKATLTVATDVTSASIEIFVRQTALGTINTTTVSGVETFPVTFFNEGDMAFHFAGTVSLYASDIRYDAETTPLKLTRYTQIQLTIPFPNLSGTAYNLATDGISMSYTDAMAQPGASGNIPVWSCEKGSLVLNSVIDTTFTFTATDIECTDIQTKSNTISFNGNFTIIGQK